MTREEAIEILQWYVDDAGISSKDFNEALDMALSALRPITREQVEKVWRGEWINKHSAYDHKIFTCARCGKRISIQGENLNFCPHCGSPMTDEAVEMVMERLEVLYEET